MATKKTSVKPKKKAAKPAKTSKLKIFTKSSNQGRNFVLCDGNSIKCIKDLALGLADLQEDVFYYHVNTDKDDFSSWIKEVFLEIELADKLMQHKNKDDYQLVLLRHIVEKI